MRTINQWLEWLMRLVWLFLQHYILKITDFFLSHGIHVLVEKPITDNIKTAQKLLEKAKNNNLILFIGHLERFNPCINP